MSTPERAQAPAPEDIEQADAPGDQAQTPRVDLQAATTDEAIRPQPQSTLDLPEPSQTRSAPGASHSAQQLAEQRAQKLEEGIDAVSTQNPGIRTSPGAPPTVPQQGASRPTRVDDETTRQKGQAHKARELAHQTLAEGPSADDLAPAATRHSFEVGELAEPKIGDEKPVAGADQLNELGVEPALTMAFDKQQGPAMAAKMDAAVTKTSGAVAERDKARQDALKQAQQEQDAANHKAQADQDKALHGAKKAIRDKKQAALDAQKDAVGKLGEDLDAEHKKKRKAIGAKLDKTDADIKARYDKTEREAHAKVAAGEQKARSKKQDQKKKAEDQSWWDRATSWLKAQLHKLEDTIAGIFDKVRGEVNGLIDDAVGFATGLIDEAASAIKDIADTFSGFAKGLVDTLLSETFPGLADELNQAIDAATATFKRGVDAAAGYAKTKIKQAAKDLKKGLNAVVSTFQKALHAAFSAANAALSMSFSDVGKLLMQAALSAAGIDPKAFFALIDKAQGDLLAIVKNPAGFFKNVGQALLGGFKRFTAHFVTHLEQGFVAWLTGALSAIDMPEHFDLMGVLSIARQVLGLSWDYLKDKAAQLIGQKNVERIEWVVEQLQTLIEGGWGALLAKIKDSLTGLKDEIFGKIEQFLVVNVVKTAIVKLAGLFSPVGAVIELVETLWNVYQTLKDQLARIFGVVKTVVDGLDDIVKGKLAPAEHKVESVLAGLLPTAIDLLARLIGLGGLGHKVEEFIKAVRARVDKAITALINKIKAKFKSLFGRGKAGRKRSKPTPAVLRKKRAFKVDGNEHHLWIARRGRKLVPMVASQEQPVEKLIDDASKEAKEPSQSAESVLAKLDHVLARYKDDPKRGDLDQVDSLEAELVRALADVMGGMGASKFSPEQRVTLFATASRWAPQNFKVGIFQTVKGQDITPSTKTSPEPFKRSNYLTFQIEKRKGGDKHGYEKEWPEDRKFMLSHAIKGSIRAAAVKQESGPLYAFVDGAKAAVVLFTGEKAAAPELVKAVKDLKGAEAFEDFLLELIRKGEANGLKIKDYVKYLSKDAPRRGKNRKLVGDLIRSMESGTHEWLPVSIAGEVADYAWKLRQNEKQKEKALYWIKAQFCLRTSTNLLLLRRFHYELIPVPGAQDERMQANATESSETVRVEGANEDAQVVGIGAHPGSALTKLARVTSMVEPFHEFLRQTFRDTVAPNDTKGPGAFLDEVNDKLGVLLWDGSDIRPADENVRVGSLDAADAKQLEAAAAEVGMTLGVSAGDMSLDDLASLAEKLAEAVKEEINQMMTAKCWAKERNN